MLPPSESFAAHLEALAAGNKHMLRDPQGRLSLKNFDRKQLVDWCVSIGESPKRALQVWRWLYADGNWVASLRDTVGQQNGLAAKFVDVAEPVVTCDGGMELHQVARAKDGTRKLVFRLTAGEAAGGLVETVLIPVVRSQGQRSRITLCVSSQVGCAMNCQFCHTGKMGLLGNLTTAQIVEQVVQARRFMAQEGDSTPMTNLVFMGMGEPLHNPEAVADAINIMTCYLGLHMSHNKVTVSTVGLVPEIRRFVPRSRAQLAVSLHATTDEVRDWLVPVNRRWPLAQLTATLRELYPTIPPRSPPAASSTSAAASTATAASSTSAAAATTVSTTALPSHQHQQHDSLVLHPPEPASAAHTTSTSPQHQHQLGGGGVKTAAAGDVQGHEQQSVNGTGASGRESEEEREAGPRPEHSTLLIAYTLLGGVNDTDEDARRLLGLLEGIEAKVNLIEYNETPGAPFVPSSPEAVQRFRDVLIRGGRVCTVRSSRGDDEMAACGQLGDVGLSWKPAPVLQPPERLRLAMEEARAQHDERRRREAAQALDGSALAAAAGC